MKFGHLGKLLQVIRKFGFSDFLIVAGTALVFYGVSWVYWQASYILLGLWLIYWSIRREMNKPPGNK